jgi:hypothetical protein
MLVSHEKIIDTCDRKEHTGASTPVAVLLAENPGMTNVEIAAAVGCNESLVRRVRRGETYRPIPEPVRQALIAFPTLNHAALARKLGADPRVVANFCKHLIAEGAYAECRHHFDESGQHKIGGPQPRAMQAGATYIAPSAEKIAELEATIRHLEAENARLAAALSDCQKAHLGK